MKKGIIIEIKNKQKVVLADNGRFYVRALKKEDAVGKRVSIGTAKRRIAAVSVMFVIAASAFTGGMKIMDAVHSDVAETMVHISVPGRNMAVEVLINSKGRVLSAAPVSENAAALIAGEALEGKKIEDASVAIARLAADCGFLLPDSENYILINSYNDDLNTVDKLNRKITLSLDRYFQQSMSKTFIVSNAEESGGKVSLINCASNMLAPVYTVGKINQREGDKRKLLDIIAEVKQYSDKELMLRVIQAHISYHQSLTPQQKDEFKSLKQQWISGTRKTFVKDAEEYRNWLNSKPDKIAAFFGSYESQAFSAPHYLTVTGE